MSDLRSQRRLRKLWWVAIVLLALAVLPQVALYLAWEYSEWRGAQELARLRQAGAVLNVSELLPKLKPGEPNAAMVYEQAFAIEPAVVKETERGPKWDPAAVGPKLVAKDGEYFARLERAARLPTCLFIRDWDTDWNPHMPELAHFRAAGYALEAKAEVERRAGRLDEAVATSITSLRVADHCTQEPTLVSHLVAVAIQGFALRELPRVFSTGDPSPEACRALYDELDRRRRVEPFVTALRGDRANGLAIFRAVERSRKGIRLGDAVDPDDESDRITYSRSPIGRYIWSRDKRSYVDLTTRGIEAARRPYREAAEAMRAVDRTETGLRLAPMTAMLTPVYPRTLWIAYRPMALAGAAQIAAAAKSYKRTHGKYPASLEELAKDGWALPNDPFADQPYHYRLERQGLAVWSVGPDLTDNGATDYNPKIHHWDQPGYDHVFRCSR